MLDKKSDLAGPGISTYEAVDKILPRNYESLLDIKRTQQAIYDVKDFIEKGLARELNLMMVQVPLIVEAESGMNDMLDRDGSRTPVEFPCGLGLETPIRASIVQAATKWKTCAPCARTISSITITAPMSTSGTGNRSSRQKTAISNT
jgi:aspartate--ammonia ligase